MLREFSDRGPEPPRFKTILLWAAIVTVAVLLGFNVVQGISTGAWNW